MWSVRYLEMEDDDRSHRCCSHHASTLRVLSDRIGLPRLNGTHLEAMRAVIQRCTSASVTVSSTQVSSIGRGLMVLVGIGTTDTSQVGLRPPPPTACFSCRPELALGSAGLVMARGQDPWSAALPERGPGVELEAECGRGGRRGALWWVHGQPSHRSDQRRESLTGAGRSFASRARRVSDAAKSRRADRFDYPSLP